MILNGQDIGGAHATPAPGGWQLRQMQLDKQFRGMGLGKKLMGGIMQTMQPGQTLFGDAQVSPQAQSVLSSMTNRPGLWQAKPGLPGGVPQPGVRPVGNFKGLVFPTPTYDALKGQLPTGLQPYHHAFMRMPIGTTPKPALPAAVTSFVNKLG